MPAGRLLLQMRAVARITASPVVETLPCVGGVSITLLRVPHFDASFKIADSFDFMALPFVHEAIVFGSKVGLRCQPRKHGLSSVLDA